MKSAALIVIGDEILTGKVRDENSFVFAKAMFDRGVYLKRIFVIPDDIDIIAKSVLETSLQFDYVCTSGGVGPTHDDKTFEAIGKGFSMPIKEHEDAVSYFREAQQNAGRGDTVSEIQKKMLRYPSPCEAFFIKPLWLPLIKVNNVFIFPGVPYLFEKMINGFIHLFEAGKFFREVMFTDLSENKIAADLKMVQDQYPGVAIGSYPRMPGGPYSVMVTVEGLKENEVSFVAAHLMPLIGGRKVAE